MLDNRTWNEGYTTSHNSSLPHRPPKDPFLEREYERERIREEVLREEVRSRIIEEEVRSELEMERYNLPKGKAPCKHPKRGGIQHKITEINEEELMSIAPVNDNNVNPSNKEEIQKEKQMVQTELNESKVVVNVSDIPHKMTHASVEEIRWPQSLLRDKVQSPKNQEESRPSASLPEDALAKDHIKSPNSTKSTEKKENGKVSLEPHSENKFKEPACSKAPFPEEALPKDKMKVLPNRNGVVEGGDGENVLKPETVKIEQLAFSESPKGGAGIGQVNNKPCKYFLVGNCNYGDRCRYLHSRTIGDALSLITHLNDHQKEILKTAEACTSKRKSDTISAVYTPPVTRSSVKLGQQVKRQKVDKKGHSCTICNVTVYSDHVWLAHLNGKRHRNMLKELAEVEMNTKVSSDISNKSMPGIEELEMNTKVSSDIGNKSMPGIELLAVKEEMDNGDSLATKPTGEELQKGIIKKIKVGCNEHDVVEKNNSFWCEMCKYNCTSMVMMTVHLVS